MPAALLLAGEGGRDDPIGPAAPREDAPSRGEVDAPSVLLHEGGAEAGEERGGVRERAVASAGKEEVEDPVPGPYPEEEVPTRRCLKLTTHSCLNV